MSVVELRNLSKWFGDVVAINEVSLDIDRGVTALLGPNGAGKSTLLRVLCGLTRPSQGTVRVLGEDPRTRPSLGGRLALVPQQEALPERLTGRRFVSLMAAMSGIPKPDAAAEAAINRVELDPTDKRPLKTYSKGMRQRIKVAQALVGEPEVIVLDEPLEGLDPRQRVLMIDLFRSLGAEGRTVLVSSHVLEEVERFGSRVVVLAQARLAAEGDFREIRELMDDRPHSISVSTNDPRGLANALVSADAVSNISFPKPGTVLCQTENVGRFRTEVVIQARDIGARLTEIRPTDDDLESVFRYLVERR